MRSSSSDSRGSVLITSNFSNRTGFAWTAFFRVFNRIAREAHDRGLGVVLSFAEIEGTVDILDPDIPHEIIQFDAMRVDIGGLVRLARDIRRHRIRYAYMTDHPSWRWLYGIMRLSGVERIVPHSHVSVSNPYPAEPERGARRLAKTLLHRLPWITADHVLTCSQFVKDRLVRQARCPEGRITVLNYGLPESRFQEPAPISVRPSNRPVQVFCASRAARVKGVQHLIAATRILLDREGLPDFQVTYAGSGPDLDEFKKLADDAELGPRFRFLGFVDDTTKHLHEADIVVIPSVWGDAFPYAVLEALAAGKAIVASRAGGIPEEIGDPSCGVLVPPGDPLALADALERLLKEPQLRHEMGVSAFRRASQRFKEAPYFEAVVERVFDAFGLPASTRKRSITKELAS